MATNSGRKKKTIKRKAFETSLEQVLTDVSSLSSSKKKKTLHDESWEGAVTKARGIPDGDSDSIQDQNSPKENGKKFEKGKKKPLNMIKTAAKKFKTINKQGHADDGQQSKGTKRKLARDDGDKGEEKGAKLEEMTFKERKKQRKTQKTNYDDALKAKSLWEKLRRQDMKPEKRKEVTDELYSLIKGRAKELIFAHDTCRVIQCLMKYGDQGHREALFEELREHIIEMSKSKYAKFFVRKLLKYGTTSQRKFIFKSMHGNVRKLIKHKEAAEIIELAYNDYANAHQRSALVEEFYGPSFALFKTEEARTIGQIMTSNPEKRDSILSNMKEALASLINKNLCQYTIVHKIFLEYFSFATEKARAEMIELVRENLIHMLHTREGARITMHCIWSGTTKDRKVIVKSMKTFVAKICKEEFGHLALIAIFDVVDDTKLVQKAILEEMFKSVDDVAQDQYGRKVLLYLLAPRDPAHFHPDVIKILEQGDGNTTSKKDPAIRRAELLLAVSEPLLKYVASHTKVLVMNNATLLLLIAVLKHTQGDKAYCYKAVAAIAAEKFVAGSLENFHIVEHPVGHLVLKRLIMNDKEKVKCGQSADFAKILVDTISDSDFKAWAACNRGCFIILSLLELEVPEITTRMNRAMKPVEESLKKLTFKGAQILLSKLKT